MIIVATQTEDRAMQKCAPSADLSAKTGVRVELQCSARLHSTLRIWPQRVKLSRQDAATAIRQDVLKRIRDYNQWVCGERRSRDASLESFFPTTVHFARIFSAVVLWDFEIRTSDLRLRRASGLLI